MYLAVPLCSRHSIRSSILGTVLTHISAIPDRYTSCHVHLCVAFRWGTEREGKELTAPLTEVRLRSASLQGRNARPATKRRCISVGALKTHRNFWVCWQRVTEVSVLGAHWRQAISTQTVSPKGEMNHKRVNITELQRHVISLL